MASLIAIGYVITSAFVGLMLQVFPTGSSFSIQVVAVPRSTDWWNYPALIVTSPSWVLALSLVPTATLVLVSIGVGLSMGACLVLIGARLRERRRGAGAEGAGAGVAPALAGLATLGACCCTACTATLSIGVVSSVTGTDIVTLLRNNWYLDVFQLIVVGLSLLALERGLRSADGQCVPATRWNARLWAGAAMRIALLIAGITWSMAMLVEWSLVSPLAASPAMWYHWIFEHQLLALLAIFAGLFPGDAIRVTTRVWSSKNGAFLRAALLVAGFTWGVWVPATLANLGLGGLVNEYFGVAGLPASWGAIPIDTGVGAALVFHWVFQHLLLAGFGILLAIRPRVALAPLGWTMGPRTLETKSDVGVLAT